jgi:hypothetical protein
MSSTRWGDYAEKAQALKRKNNLENEKGKKVSKHISTSSLLEIAASIDLEVPVEELSKQKVIDHVLELEIERNNSFNAACSTVDHPVKVNLKGKMTSEGSQHRNVSDHIGCSHSVGNGNSSTGSRTVGSICQSSSRKDTRDSDPTTPDGRFSKGKDLNILEAEIEKSLD